MFDTLLCDKVCQGLVTGWWFSPGTPFSSTNKTDCHNITEILLKVGLNTINHLIPDEIVKGIVSMILGYILLLYFCREMLNIEKQQKLNELDENHAIIAVFCV